MNLSGLARGHKYLKITILYSLSVERSDNYYDNYNTYDYATRVKNHDNKLASSIGTLFNGYDRQSGLDSTVSTNFRKQK